MQKFINKTIIIIYFIIMLLFALSIASRRLLSAGLSIISVIGVIAIIICIRKNIIKIDKKLLIFLFCIATSSRILVFFLSYDKPLASDYLFFYESATNFLNGQELSSRYIATFPYLAPYIMLLGVFFKIFNSNSYLLVITIHTILDIISAIMIYQILKKEDKKIGALGSILWLINPINIIWTTICCPVVIVNTGITIILYIFEKIKNSMNKSSVKFLLLNIIYGILIGIFNSFRPIFIIIIIATAMYYIYTAIKIKDNKKRVVLAFGIGIIMILYLIINSITNIMISKLVKQEISTTPGWTLYLGGNTEYNGMWNEQASAEYTEMFNNQNLTAEEMQQILESKAMEQYKNNGIQNIKLFINKFIVLTENIAGYSYQNLNDVATINENSLKIIRIYVEIFMAVIIILNIYINRYIFKNVGIFESTMLYILIAIGIILSHLFVEVSPRYMIPLLPTLTIIATYCISRIFNEKNIKLLEGKTKHE